MFSFLTTFEIGLCVNFAVFVSTLVFSQKIKDWFHGVPSDLRKGLVQVEGSITSQVKSYQADLVAKIVPPPAVVLKQLEPVVQTAAPLQPVFPPAA
jgi:hypothetical protein